MKISEKMEKLLNKQIHKEMESAYLYLAMSNWFSAQDYKGFAHWMKKQAEEELQHASKLMSYIQERCGNVSLETIAAPKQCWDSPLQAYEETLQHELAVTDWIYSLVDAAEQEKDRATQNLLTWYVNEQVEEEASVTEIIATFNKVGCTPIGLFTIDKHLAAR